MNNNMTQTEINNIKNKIDEHISIIRGCYWRSDSDRSRLHDQIVEKSLMLIDKGDIESSIKLADYYLKFCYEGNYKDKYYDEIIKHYLFAIQNIQNENIQNENIQKENIIREVNIEAMIKLGLFYYRNNEDEQAMKYLSMALDAEKISDYWFVWDEIHDYFGDIEDCADFLIPFSIKRNEYDIFGSKYVCYGAVDYKFTKEDLDILSSRSYDDLKDAPEFIKMIHRMMKSQIDIMKLHFDYTVHGEGYEKAKSDYLDKLSNHNDKSNHNYENNII